MLSYLDGEVYTVVIINKISMKIRSSFRFLLSIREGKDIMSIEANYILCMFGISCGEAIERRNKIQRNLFIGKEEGTQFLNLQRNL